MSELRAEQVFLLDQIGSDDCILVWFRMPSKRTVCGKGAPGSLSDNGQSTQPFHGHVVLCGRCSTVQEKNDPNEGKISA